MMSRVRVLFSCTATEGHIAPLIPLARALARLTHDVAFATAPAFEPRVRAEGFVTFPAGLDQAEIKVRMQAYRPRLLELAPAERRPQAYTWRFAHVDAPAKLPELQRAAMSWRPDLLVHDAAELCAPPVAASLGIPSVNHAFGQVIPAACHELAAGAVRALWDTAGVEPEDWNGMYRGAYVDICPPSLAGESVPEETPRYALRPADGPNGRAAVPWRLADPALPNVYVTLGTVLDEAAVLRLLLDALADVDCNVLMTIGRRGDPSSLAPWPANATVERFVPQAAVLPHCKAVVSHGGSGTTYGALAHGLPLLILPHGADQFDNAVAARAAGVAQVLMPHEIDAAAVRSAVETLLGDPSYASRAQSLAAEIAAMPNADQVAAALAAAVATAG
jgi:UDP:flavonoid glycosyltransferase YjiC (YdhE family)